MDLVDKFRTIIRQGQSLDINRTYVGHILDIPEFVQTLSGPALATSTKLTNLPLKNRRARDIRGVLLLLVDCLNGHNTDMSRLVTIT